MKYFKLNLNTSGFGFELANPKTVCSESLYFKGYYRVEELGFEFDIFPEEDIISGTREIYIISTILANNLLNTNLTGFEIDNVKIEYSLNYKHFHQDKQNLQYHWLKVCGVAGLEDFGLTEKYELVVSENALSFLRDFKILDADIMPFS